MRTHPTASASASRRQVLAWLAAAASVPSHPRAAAGVSLLPPSAQEGVPGWSPLDLAEVGSAALSDVEDTYPVEFSAYLARFLLARDPASRRYWEARQAEAAIVMPRDEVQSSSYFAQVNRERRDAFLRSQFEQVVTSVEVGLAQFTGDGGIQRLADLLALRFSSADEKRHLAQLLSLVLIALFHASFALDEAAVRALHGEGDDAPSFLFTGGAGGSHFVGGYKDGGGGAAFRGEADAPPDDLDLDGDRAAAPEAWRGAGPLHRTSISSSSADKSRRVSAPPEQPRTWAEKRLLTLYSFKGATDPESVRASLPRYASGATPQRPTSDAPAACPAVAPRSSEAAQSGGGSSDASAGSAPAAAPGSA